LRVAQQKIDSAVVAVKTAKRKLKTAAREEAAQSPKTVDVAQAAVSNAICGAEKPGDQTRRLLEFLRDR